ncbi:MAG: hypothetical protein JO372_25125 [Solirubrobacterales bacterium]|nr:hypothetical protein [Solirubrobacterales bacterium]
MADWVTISSLATAGGTLVLAVATFSSVKSANRSARVAERSLLAGVRPVLIPSRDDDLVQRVRFGDGVVLQVMGHRAAMDIHNDSVYMGLGLRNGGNGLAVILGWRIEVTERTGSTAPDSDDFRGQQRDLYIPAGETGFWQGAIRDPRDPAREQVAEAIKRDARVLIDILYGDYEGGQRTIARFGVGREEDDADGYRAEVVRYWNVDGADPRARPVQGDPPARPVEDAAYNRQRPNETRRRIGQ